MDWQHPDKISVTFHDVAACFSEEEWKLLHEWQKELYKNIMKEIHQALSSLGPLIATTVFSLKPKEKQPDLCPMNSQQSARAHGDVIANPDALLGVHREERHRKIPHYTDGREINDCLSTEVQFLDQGVCLRKEEESRARRMRYICAEGGKNSTGSSLAGFSFLNTDFNLRKEDESSVGLLDNPGAGGESPTDSSLGGHVVIPEIVTVQIKEETYPMDHNDSDIIGSIATEAGDGNVSRESEAGPSAACTEKAKGNKAVLQSPEANETNLKSQMCPESNGKLPGEETAQFGHAFKAMTQSFSHQAPYQKERPDTMNVCGNRFVISTDPISLQRTHTATNQSEGPFQCRDYDKSSSRRHNLIGHQRIHTEERPYQCSKCEKKFVHKGNFNIHQRTHTGEKPYRCTGCGKGFSRKGNLSIHERTHTGEKPHQCSQCGKGFTQKTHLLVHERTHMGDKYQIRP